MPSGGVAGPYSSSVIAFTRRLCAVSIITGPVCARPRLQRPRPHQHLLTPVCGDGRVSSGEAVSRGGLACISLTVSGGERLFMYPLATRVSSLEKCLFGYFACSLNQVIFSGYFVLASSCRGSSFIVDVNPLSHVCFANIISRSVDCLFIPLFPW